MKRLVDLLRINEGRFTAIILSVMTIAALISLKGNLISGGAVPCMYDEYLVGVLHVVSTFCVPFVLFYILFVDFILLANIFIGIIVITIAVNKLSTPALLVL